MRALIIFMFVSFNAFAGDLSVICFENQDPGQYVYISDVFMDEDQIYFDFVHDETKFDFFIKRESLFKNYEYIVELTHIESSEKATIKYRVDEYDSWVQVSANLTCATMD